MVSPRIDRIVFAYDRSLDFTAGASSLPDPVRDKWNDVLRGHVLVSHERRPATSMWYWSDGEEAAVLWRMAASGDGREDRCHALVGSTLVLDTPMALALNNWDGWTGEEWASDNGTPLPPVTTLQSDYRGLARDTSNQSAEHDLIPVVRAFLLDPERPVSVVTDAVDGDGKLHLLWDVVNIVGALFGPADLWTFSTFEARHDESVRRLPRIVFVPSDHQESRSYPVKRTTVPLPADKVLASDFYQRIAELLVSRYRSLGQAGLADWLAGHGVFDVDKPRDRLTQLRKALESRPPSRDPAPPTGVELLTRLRTVRRESLDEVLAEIRRRRVAPVPDRGSVLRFLLANPEVVVRVSAIVESERAIAAVDALIGFAIDGMDWRDHRVVDVIGRAIAEPETPPIAQAGLIRAAIEHGAWTSLATGLATRHVRDLGFDVRYPDSVSASRQTITAPRRHTVLSRLRQVILRIPG